MATFEDIEENFMDVYDLLPVTDIVDKIKILSGKFKVGTNIFEVSEDGEDFKIYIPIPPNLSNEKLGELFTAIGSSIVTLSRRTNVNITYGGEGVSLLVINNV